MEIKKQQELPEGTIYTSNNEYSGLANIGRASSFGNKMVENARFGRLKNQKISNKYK